ncbi:DUF6106 family protein [Acetivibrio clariflavus]|uniref:Uncharacterized protein n=1 Tax=Acetivibrio clariflavus (strain DSM 19732 / NBRC 101661 / EBR45) TaxID=720554 RepID=G8M2I5_ACECE|nr:DUF6106 family protein [Acetivibrio clariflavus]AEV70355.1 hypothetical protein Clocl_3915 [Acetivibrio clariflavus DSM 19732]
MDIFVERIVSKKKGPKEYLKALGIVLIAFLVSMVVTAYFFPDGIVVIAYVGIVYAAKHFIGNLNVEYEYSLTNGDLDIDKIINKKKRKPLYSTTCKDIEQMAKVSSSQYNESIAKAPLIIKAVSSMDSPNVYYAVINSSGRKVTLYFEPDEKMLKNLKIMLGSKLTI